MQKCCSLQDLVIRLHNFTVIFNTNSIYTHTYYFEQFLLLIGNNNSNLYSSVF